MLANTNEKKNEDSEKKVLRNIDLNVTNMVVSR